MIPLQLTLEGLYSYQKRQTVDFQKLTQAGLFGIFGSVGSGKSSILEAISFALYGETERLHSRDNRAYNMMNLKSDRSYIEFDFLNFENRKFRATREFKRNSKNFEDVKASAVLYEWKNGRWEPLETTKADEIIGLTYSNFKRTIIIPQGQFKEFLELGAKDRTVMMKEIFGLERFDLQYKVADLSSENKGRIGFLEGQLKGYEEISEEYISEHNEILRQQTEVFEVMNLEFDKLSQQYRLQTSLKADFEVLTQKKESLKALEIQKNSLEDLEKRTEKYDQVYTIFHPLLSEKQKLGQLQHARAEELLQQQKKVQEIAAQHAAVKKDLEIILPQYQTLEEHKIREHDLNLIVQMQDFTEEIKTLSERTRNGASKVAKVLEAQKVITAKIKVLREKSESLKAKRLDAEVLIKVGAWFSAHKNMHESFLKQSQKVHDCKSRLQEITEEINTLEINENHYFDDFRVKTQQLEDQKKSAAAHRNHLEVQQKLAKFSEALHDGEACPLCGATDHPDIVQFEDVQAEIEKVDQELQSLEKNQEKLRNAFSAAEKMLDRKKIFESQLKSEEEACAQIQRKQDEHVQTFKWKGFDVENEPEFERQRTEALLIERQIEELSRNIVTEQNNLTQSQHNLDKFNKALQDFRLQENKVETQFSSSRSNLKFLNWCVFEDKSRPETTEELAQLKMANRETEEAYQLLTKKEAEILPELTVQNTILSQLEKRIAEIADEIRANHSILKHALVSHQFQEISEVQEILAQEISVKENRSIIQNFKMEFGILSNSISELSLKLKDFTFDTEQFAKLQHDFTISEAENKTAAETLVKLKAEIGRLEAEFKKKEILIKDLTQLQKRAENLKVMTNLFKGAGFVQYASSIYLQQLCDHANIRFHRMTRNQLSLQLNENNDFEIVDYLNEGRKRSVKTLSGGQAFQVSLSLALALAESVPSNAAAERNFFFIDEGFGTQDPESVQVIFETLWSLQKENRTVGIISHVEELKEKMPVSLNIRKDEEHGSIIELTS